MEYLMLHITKKGISMNKSGFTLIELMIVIAIIAIIAAIAIPNLLRASIAANEASAVSTLRTIVTAEKQFAASGANVVNNVSQYGSLTSLGNVSPPFLDQLLGQADAVKSGYQFSLALTTGSATSFEVTGLPVRSRSGSRTFFVDSSGVLTYLPGTTDAPDSDSPPLQ
jgi:type IV pilus assembly protein PilA